MKIGSLFAAGSVVLVAGCASNPDNIDAAYVSPLKYQNYDCSQIGTELDYVSQRTTSLFQNLKDKRKADNWQMGVGLVLFWPALFALEGGDGADAAEYSQLKGEFEALRQVSTQKRCNIAMQSPDEILNAAADVDNSNSTTSNSTAPESDLTKKLQQLDDLKKQGRITEEEYTKARARALDID